MKIKVKLFEGGRMPMVSDKGDLFDVYSAEDVLMQAPQAGVQRQVNSLKVRDVSFEHKLIKLGFAMEIPKGFKANLYPRSSTYKNWKVIFANHVGQIDSSYRGDNDEWLLSVISLDATEIHKGDRIAQFEIVPSGKATVRQKLKWLFSNKIEFVQVQHLNNEDRNGFGSTGAD